MHRDCAIEPLQPENSTRERRKRSGRNVEWLQASGSNRASAAYETAEDASPHACNVWWRTRVTLPACDACKAMLRSCAIPAKIWSPTCDSNAEAAVSETARYPEIPVSWGEAMGRSPGFDPGPARSQRAMQTITPQSPSLLVRVAGHDPAASGFRRRHSSS
jgi:hypothetical protein